MCSTQYVFDAVSIDDAAIWGMYRYTWSFVTASPPLPPPPAAPVGMSVDDSALPSGNARKRNNNARTSPSGRLKMMKPSDIHINIDGDTGATGNDRQVYVCHLAAVRCSKRPFLSTPPFGGFCRGHQLID